MSARRCKRFRLGQGVLVAAVGLIWAGGLASIQAQTQTQSRTQTQTTRTPSGTSTSTRTQTRTQGRAPATAQPSGKAQRGPKVLAAGPDLWKVQVDPPANPPAALPDDEIALRVPNGWGNEEVVYPNGPSTFVAIGGKGSREVWDLATKKRVGVIRSDAIEKPLALSDDGSLLAGKTGGFNRGVAVFATKTGKQVAQLKAEHPFLDVVVFAGLDKIITGRAGDRQFEVWDIEAGKSETDISPRGPVAADSVAVSPGGKYLAFASTEGKGLWVHDIESGKRVGEIEIPKNNIFNLNCKGLMFSPDGTELAGVFESFGVYLFCWDVATGKNLAEFNWNDKAGNIKAPTGFNGRGLDWLPDKSGWLLFGTIVVDRGSGEKVFTIPSDTPGAEKGARRVLGNGLVLIPVEAGGSRTLRSYKLPTDKIAEAAKIVQAGGNAADATLPALKTADLSGAKKVSTGASVAWSAAADPAQGSKSGLANRPLTLKCGANEVERLHFAGLAAAQVAVTSIPGGLNPFNPNENEGKPRRVETYDLAGGRFLARFDLPGVSEPLALSPDAARIAATDTKEHTRLDIYTVADGQPVASFRPYDKESGDFRSIAWAGFLDADRILTASKGGAITLWTLPDCKAVWTADRACDGAPALSPGRKSIAAYDNGSIRLLDAATGATQGTSGPASSPGTRAELTGLAFSSDGGTIVAFVGGSQLLRWDAASGKLTADFRTPMTVQPQANTYGAMVEVCDAGHALLDGRILMDLDRRAHIWSYYGSKTSAAGPDGRHWYVAGGLFTVPGQAQAAALVPLVIPDPTVNRVVEMVGNASVKPLLRVGMKVAVTLEFNGPAKNPQEFKNQVYQALESKLKANGMTVGDGGGVWVIVHVDEKPTGQTFKYRNFGDSPFNGPRGEVPLLNYEVEMQIADTTGRIPLAPKQSFPMPSPHLVRIAPGEDLGNHLKDMAWNNMRGYLLNFGLPYFVLREANGVAQLPGVTNLDAPRR